MYVFGKGHQFSPDEKVVFDQAVETLSSLVESGSTGERQNALTELLQAIQPAFSVGEMSHSIRMFQETKLL